MTTAATKAKYSLKINEYSDYLSVLKRRKVMKGLLRLIIAICFILFIAGCKKNKTDAQQNTCKITIVAPDGGLGIIAYNNSGQVSSITWGNSVTTYSYNGNTITESGLIDGDFRLKVIVTVNSVGLATNVRIEYSEDGSAWANQAYEYNGNKASKVTKTNYGGGGASVFSTFQWSGGNLESITDGNDVTKFDYFTDKLSLPGDYLALMQLTQGYEVFRNQNLIKSITDSTGTWNITYTFDNDGKVTSLQKDKGIYHIAYQVGYQYN